MRAGKYTKVSVNNSGKITEVGYLETADLTSSLLSGVQTTKQIPYAISTGIASMSFSASANSDTKSIVFPVGKFSYPPIITAQVTGFASILIGSTIRIANVTANGFDMIQTLTTSHTTTANVEWIAIQQINSAYAVDVPL
jgi:hypothetical protein